MESFFSDGSPGGKGQVARCRKRKGANITHHLAVESSDGAAGDEGGREEAHGQRE
jgi:hypothetical protein